MNLTGLMLARRDSWCMRAALAAALAWCDSVLLMLDRPAAEDREIASEFERGGRLKVIEPDPTPLGWAEMWQRQKMLCAARDAGATHIAVVDSDELLTADLIPVVRPMIETLGNGEQLAFRMVSPYHGTNLRRIDGPWGHGSVLSLAFRDNGSCEWATRDGYQFHQRMPRGVAPGHVYTGRNVERCCTGVIHMQFASRRRLAAKAVWYKMMEMLQHPGTRTTAALNEMYDWTLREDGMITRPIPTGAWPAGALDAIDLGAAPWQEAEISRMLSEHGPERFRGIDDHGLFDRLAQGVDACFGTRCS